MNDLYNCVSEHKKVIEHFEHRSILNDISKIAHSIRVTEDGTITMCKTTYSIKILKSKSEEILESIEHLENWYERKTHYVKLKEADTTLEGELIFILILTSDFTDKIS